MLCYLSIYSHSTRSSHTSRSFWPQSLLTLGQSRLLHHYGSSLSYAGGNYINPSLPVVIEYSPDPSAPSARPDNSCEIPFSLSRQHAVINPLSVSVRTLQQIRRRHYLFTTALYHQNWNQIRPKCPFQHLRPHHHSYQECKSHLDSSHNYYP